MTGHPPTRAALLSATADAQEYRTESATSATSAVPTALAGKK